MSAGNWFWLCLFLALVLGGVGVWRSKSWDTGGVSLLILLALLLVGIEVFGGPIK